MQFLASAVIVFKTVILRKKSPHKWKRSHSSVFLSNVCRDCLTIIFVNKKARIWARFSKHCLKKGIFGKNGWWVPSESRPNFFNSRLITLCLEPRPRERGDLAQNTWTGFSLHHLTRKRIAVVEILTEAFWVWKPRVHQPDSLKTKRKSSSLASSTRNPEYPEKWTHQHSFWNS